MEQIKFKLTGTSPLMMHSDRGANPLDPMARELKVLTSTRKKTEDVHAQVARMEWELGLYFDQELGPYVPSPNLRATLVEGAKLNKLGMAVKRATLILSEREKLQYKGPRDIDALWEGGYRDTRSVVIPSGGRVMRCRPVFPSWTLSFDLLFDSSVLQREQLILAATSAGQLIGLCELRPACGGSYGRFTVEAS